MSDRALLVANLIENVVKKIVPRRSRCPCDEVAVAELETVAEYKFEDYRARQSEAEPVRGMAIDDAAGTEGQQQKLLGKKERDRRVVRRSN